MSLEWAHIWHGRAPSNSESYALNLDKYAPVPPGATDYGPFIDHGIPAGGLFTGAEGIKTAEEEPIWGGTAGQQYDPCFNRRATRTPTSTCSRSTSTPTP